MTIAINENLLLDNKSSEEDKEVRKTVFVISDDFAIPEGIEVPVYNKHESEKEKKEANFLKELLSAVDDYPSIIRVDSDQVSLLAQNFGILKIEIFVVPDFPNMIHNQLFFMRTSTLRTISIDDLIDLRSSTHPDPYKGKETSDKFLEIDRLRSEALADKDATEGNTGEF